MTHHEIYGALSAIVEVLCFIPYYIGIFRGSVKPHLFTWALWCLMSGIIFAAQYVEGAGPGAWMTGMNAVVCLAVALLSLRQGMKYITRIDIVLLVIALLAIPLWQMTHTPLWSVIILCIIDVIAFMPTIRKSWFAPRTESILTYMGGVISCSLALAALEHVNLVTVLFPFCLVVLNGSFVLMLFTRRRVVNK